MELIIISDMMMVNKCFGYFVVQCLDESLYLVIFLYFYVKIGGMYWNWVVYWGGEGEGVMVYGKGFFEGNYMIINDM